MFDSFQTWQANFTYAVGKTPLSTWQAAGATIAGYLAILVVLKRYVKANGPNKLKSIFVGAMSAAPRHLHSTLCLVNAAQEPC